MLDPEAEAAAEPRGRASESRDRHLTRDDTICSLELGKGPREMLRVKNDKLLFQKSEDPARASETTVAGKKGWGKRRV